MNTTSKCFSEISWKARASLLGWVAVWLALGDAARGDWIELSSGNKQDDVTITAARWDQVQYTIGTASNALKGETIYRLHRTSRRLAPIRKAIADGDFGDAAKLLADTTGLDWEQAEKAYLKGKVHLLQGSPERAKKALQEYLSKHRNDKDWWVPHAVYDVGLAALELNDASGALASFQELEQFGSAWQLRSKLGQARAQLAAGKYLEARGLFNDVATARNAPVALSQEARVGRAEVLIQQKQYPQALADLERAFFKDPKPEELVYSEPRARATYLMGVSYKMQDELDQAEIWLLRTALLFRKHGSVYRQACADLAEVYAKLGKSERAAEWRRRLEGGSSGNGDSATGKKTSGRKKSKKNRD